MLMPKATSCSRSTIRRRWSCSTHATPRPRRTRSSRAVVLLPDPEFPRSTTSRVPACPVVRVSGKVGAQDVGEVELDRLLELLVRARLGVAVGAPADELGGVPEPDALHREGPDHAHTGQGAVLVVEPEQQ